MVYFVSWLRLLPASGTPSYGTNRPKPKSHFTQARFRKVSPASTAGFSRVDSASETFPISDVFVHSTCAFHSGGPCRFDVAEAAAARPSKALSQARAVAAWSPRHWTQ